MILRYKNPSTLKLNATKVILGAAIGLMSAQASFAQDVGPLQQFQGVIGVQSGEFKFYDLGKIQSDYLNKFRDSQVEQKNYVINAVKEINQSFDSLLKGPIYGSDGLQTIHDEMSASGGTADYGRFLRAIRVYGESKARFDNALGAFAAIPGAIRSSTDVTLEGSGIVKLPGLISGDTIDFTPILKHYDNQLAPVIAKIESLKFNILTPANVFKANVGLDFKPEMTLSKEQREKLRASALKDLVPNSKLREAARGYLVDIRSTIQSFINTYGTSQKFRMAVGAQKEDRDKMLNTIEEYFFSRSLLRLRFGVMTGSFDLVYNKAKFNADWVTTDTKDLLTFNSGMIYDDMGRLIKVRDDLEVALVTARSRASKLKAPSLDNLFSKETVATMLNNVATSATFLAGNSQLALVNVWIIDLIKKDVEEEIAMQSANRLALIDSMIDRRYLEEGTARQARFQSLYEVYSPDEAVKQSASGMLRAYNPLIVENLNYEDTRRTAETTLAEIDAANGINPLAQKGRSRTDSKFKKK